jgi:hypothetical protein
MSASMPAIVDSAEATSVAPCWMSFPMIVSFRMSTSIGIHDSYADRRY